jgi:hypothetical protein
VRLILYYYYFYRVRICSVHTARVHGCGILRTRDADPHEICAGLLLAGGNYTFFFFIYIYSILINITEAPALDATETV